MNYTIEGEPLPVVTCVLEPGETMITEKGAMSWMSPNMKMETSSNGGIGKMFGRAFSGEHMFQNRYTAIGSNGTIAFASCFPGSIKAFNIAPGQEIIAQKSAFLASTVDVELSVFFQGVAGNKIYNANNIDNVGMAAAYNQTTDVLNRWRGEGTSYSMPRAVFGDPNQNCRVSDRFVEDGSYLRVKNITLSYTFPKQWLQKLQIENARLSLSCENVATITGYSGFDPEVDINGIDLSRYPISRTFSVGLNFNF